jgi:fermentation-respiration switch protein FrsA (DUF1100 family)
VSVDDPPFLIMHGTQDNTVNIRQAERLYQSQKQIGANSVFVKIEGGGHGFGGPEVNARVKAFLDKHLLGKDVEISDMPIESAPKTKQAVLGGVIFSPVVAFPVPPCRTP